MNQSGEPTEQDSVTVLEVAAGPRCPSGMRANVPAAGGRILPDLPRTVYGVRFVRRLHLYRLDHGMDIGDQVAIAVDRWLTEQGY